MTRSAALVVVLAMLAVVPACLGDGGGDGDVTPVAQLPTPTPTPTPTVAPPSETDLAELVLAELGGDARVRPLGVPAGWDPTWLASSPPGDGSGEGVVALYRVDGSGWREVSRMAFDEWRDVREIDVAPDAVWLQVGDGSEGNRGHRLLSFDESTLRLRFESPPMRAVMDYDGDGLMDVVVDASVDPCQGCGVVEAFVDLWRWDGERFAPAQLQRLPATAPAKLRDIVSRAIDLAEAGLWPDAADAIADTTGADVPPDLQDAVTWNIILIDFTARDRGSLGADSLMPLATYVLAGDYNAAVDQLRPLTPGELFDRNGPLLAGTPAAENVDALATLLIERAGRALTVRRDLAAAYFVRGLGRYLLDPNDVVTARADVRQALGLQPYDRFYAENSHFLHQIAAPAQAR